MVAMNSGRSEEKLSVGTDATVGSETFVAFPHCTIGRIYSSNEVVSGTLFPNVSGLADQANQEEGSYPACAGDNTEDIKTIRSDQNRSRNTTEMTYGNLARNSIGGGFAGELLPQGIYAYIPKQEYDPEDDHNFAVLERDITNAESAEKYGMTCKKSDNTIADTPSVIDGSRSFAHTTRISPGTYKWLTQNFEIADNKSLPRSTVYSYYLRHCEVNNEEPLNAATFGKKFRVAFPKLKLRRLGMRGKSKCHYYGIHVIPGSGLSKLLKDQDSDICQEPSSSKVYEMLSDSEGIWSGKQETESQYQPNDGLPVDQSDSRLQHPNQLHYLGYIPDFPSIQFPLGHSLPEDCTKEDMDMFIHVYKRYCDVIMDAVLNLEFHRVQTLWTHFWRSQDNNNEECEGKTYLSKMKLYLLCKFEPIQTFVRRVDYLVYQNIVERLFPNVLNPISISLTQAITHFANEVESWLKVAMRNCPEEITCIKLSAVSALAQMLRRYVSLNHVAQTASPVLQDSSQIEKMLVDLNRVDIRNLQDQASWVCNCDESVIQQLEANFKNSLYQQKSLEQWIALIQSAVVDVLKPYEGKSNFVHAAKQFLLKLSFYTSVVIRSLTFPCAETFGSFHLLRVLHDEYVTFLIQHQVALQTGELPIMVLGDRGTKSPTTCE